MGQPQIPNHYSEINICPQVITRYILHNCTNSNYTFTYEVSARYLLFFSDG